MAEVLITLGIIGVVCAITMPSLIANYQKRVWVTQLQKTVTTFQNGIRMINASEGVDNIFHSSYGTTGDDRNCTYCNYEVYPDKIAKFLGFEKAPKTCKIEFEDGEYHLPYALKSGACFEFYGTCMDSGGVTVGFAKGYKPGDDCVVEFYIDVNGSKGPNKFGRDIFSFDFYPDGRTNAYMVDVVMYDIDLKSLCTGKTEESDDWLGSCGYYIMQNGWKMDY